MSLPEFEPLDGSNQKSPEIPMFTEEIFCTLTWDDTFLREYDVGDDCFDHIYHKYDPDNAVVVFKHLDEPLWHRLVEERYERRTLPQVDESIRDLYINMMVVRLGDAPPIEAAD